MRSALRFLAAPLLVVAFLYLVARIAMTPLESGDSYPAYSTLRPDPLGGRILYESLTEVSGLRVERNFKPLSALIGTESGTLIFLGANGPAFGSTQDGQLKEWEQLASAGWRLAFLFRPSTPVPEPPPVRVVTKKPDGSEETVTVKAPATVTRWGIRTKLRTATFKQLAEMKNAPRQSALYFEADSSWNVLAHDQDGKSATLEKQIGKGTVYLMAQSFPFSNEGLREKRNGELIRSVLGSNQRIVFDEGHNGVVETGSVGSLIRRYGLQGAVLLLLLLGALFIWRNASPLLPLVEDQGPAALVGRDAHQGMLSLMRRNIPRQRLLDVCMQEWTRARALMPSLGAQRIAEAEAAGTHSALPAAQTYRKIFQILTEKR